MKRLISLVAAITFTVVAVIALIVVLERRIPEPNPGDQTTINAVEAERDRLLQRLAEIDAKLSSPNGDVSAESTAELHYVLPVQDDSEKRTSSPQWGLAAPITDGFSDPNEIVYDEHYIVEYVNWAVNAPISCGAASYVIAMPDGILKVYSGLDESYLGARFRVDDLVRFLKTRTEGRTFERTFNVRRQEAAKPLRERPDSTTARRLQNSPWERDTANVMSLLALAHYKPAYPLFKALLNDRSIDVRALAVLALGRMTPVIPEAVKDLASLLADQELGQFAADGLTMAGEAAVPTLVEAMNHAHHSVRQRAVFALARLDPFDAAAPGLLAALDHKDQAVRKWALSAVIDLQGRGVSVAKDEIIDSLARRLADGDDEMRRDAAIALVNLKSAAARARPALVKAAEQDRGYKVSDYAKEALKAIDAVAPPPK